MVFYAGIKVLVLDLTDSSHYYCIVANSIQCCMVACAIAVLLPVPLFCRTVLCRTSACRRRNTRFYPAPPLYHAAPITCCTALYHAASAASNCIIDGGSSITITCCTSFPVRCSHPHGGAIVLL